MDCIQRKHRLLSRHIASRRKKAVSEPSLLSSDSTAETTVLTDDGALSQSEHSLGLDDSPIWVKSRSSQLTCLNRSMSLPTTSAVPLVDDALEEEVEEKCVDRTIDNGRVGDIFASELNRSSSTLLPMLRSERLERFPVICYESDSDDDDDDDEMSSIFRRPDNNEPLPIAFDRKLGISQVLQHLSHIPLVSNKAHYFLRSAHMNIPHDYPMQ